MEMREAQPYRVAFTTVSGDVEYRDVLFAGESPPKRLVCAVCRTVSATEPRYASSRSGDFACPTCARIYAQPPRFDRGDSAESEELHEGDWNQLPQPSDSDDVRLLSEYKVLCANACLGCDFSGKLSALGYHLSFTCTFNVVACRFCGQRVVRGDLIRHVGTSGCAATSPPDAAEDAAEDAALIWVPEFVNWSRESVFPDSEQTPAAATNVVPSALNGAGPSPVVPVASANHRNWRGRARRKFEEALVPSGHLRQGSATPLAGTLLVRFPDYTPPLGAALKRPADSPVHSSRVEFFGSDHLVMDGFRLAMSAMVFYDSAQSVSGPAFSSTSPAALTKLVVFELLARDVDDSKGKYDRRRSWPPASSVALTLNGLCGEDDRLLRTRNSPDLARWPESGRWTRVATTEAVDAEVVSKKFLAFGVVGVTVEFQ